MGILQLLASRNFITVNKDLIKILGLEEAILLGELASEYDYWFNQDKLDDGYFYSTVENIQEHTTLSDHKQRKALKKLKDKGLVDVKVKGIPAKRYIKIYEEQVFELFNSQFLKNLRTRNEKNKEVDLKKLNGNNNISNNNKSNNNVYKNREENTYVIDENKVTHIDNKKREKEILESEFSSLWEKYPKKIGKENAFKDYIKFRRAGESFEDIEIGLDRYLKYIKSAYIDNRYIKNGSTWFHQKGWEDLYQENKTSSITEHIEAEPMTEEEVEDFFNEFTKKFS